MLYMLAGLGQETQVGAPFAFTAAPGAWGGFRCPAGQVPVVTPAGEVTGCQPAPMTTARVPWGLVVIVGLAAAALLWGTVR